VRISIILAPEFVYFREAFLRGAAQPILQVLPDLRIAVDIVYLHHLANHISIIASASLFCNVLTRRASPRACRVDHRTAVRRYF
jgi:hypothetical protein